MKRGHSKAKESSAKKIKTASEIERGLIPADKDCKRCPLLEAATLTGHGLGIKCSVTRASDTALRAREGFSRPAMTCSPRVMGTCGTLFEHLEQGGSIFTPSPASATSPLQQTAGAD